MKLIHWAAVWVCLAVTATLIAQNGAQRTMARGGTGQLQGKNWRLNHNSRRYSA